MSILIIAEAGVNHNGNITTAKEMIGVAAKSGADYVKFQTFKAERLVTPTSMVAHYQRKTEGLDDLQFQLLKNLELSESAHFELEKSCKEFDIKFLSTAFDIESADFLLGMGQDIFKIPSGEITNLPYLRHIASFCKEIILSTGASNIKEIDAALVELTNAGAKLEKITVLHCTSAYPAKMSEVNLNAMLNISREFSVKVGYSDHTLGIEVAIAAAALGATVIEKHFTLSRDMEGPDHKASLEPFELNEMVRSIRNIEVALGNGAKLPTPGELENIEVIRKSIVAKIAVRKGEVFTSENLTCKRPSHGISPMEWDTVVGQVAKRDYAPDEMIQID
jgi:N,N'-diacetyllegionaminate synthase